MGSGTALLIQQSDTAFIALAKPTFFSAPDGERDPHLRGSPAGLFACDRLDLDVGAKFLANRGLIEISWDFDEVEHPLGLLQWYAALLDNFARARHLSRAVG